MLSTFRLCNVMSLFVIRYFADSPFYNCLAGRIGSQARSPAHLQRAEKLSPTDARPHFPAEVAVPLLPIAEGEQLTWTLCCSFSSPSCWT